MSCWCTCPLCDKDMEDCKCLEEIENENQGTEQRKVTKTSELFAENKPEKQMDSLH